MRPFIGLKDFLGKKFVIIMSGEISASNLAYTGAIIGFQFGRMVPGMVGRDQNIPYDGGTRTHLGITTRNLPVLNGLDYAHMRALGAKLKEEKELLVTTLTDAAGKCATYDEYIQAIQSSSESETNYWGIGVFGDEEVINKYTQGLKLYGNQPKIANPTTIQKRLIGNIGVNPPLPKVSLIFANDLTGGRLANIGVILGVTLGKLYGDTIFGRDAKEQAGHLVFGLPMVDLTILNGHSATDDTMRQLRESLHATDELKVVDVTDATGKTRSYEDYLKLAENTKVMETTYWAIGISGPNELVGQYTKDLAPYITIAEEKERTKLTKKSGPAKEKQWEKKLGPVKENKKEEQKKDPILTSSGSRAELKFPSKYAEYPNDRSSFSRFSVFLSGPIKIHSAVTKDGVQINFFVNSARNIFANYKGKIFEEKDIFINVNQSPENSASFESLREINLNCQQKIDTISHIDKLGQISLFEGGLLINCSIKGAFLPTHPGYQAS